MTSGGFTLLEMIVALTILAIVLAVVAPIRYHCGIVKARGARWMRARASPPALFAKRIGAPWSRVS